MIVSIFGKLPRVLNFISRLRNSTFLFCDFVSFSFCDSESLFDGGDQRLISNRWRRAFRLPVSAIIGAQDLSAQDLGAEGHSCAQGQIRDGSLFVLFAMLENTANEKMAP